MKIKFYIAVVIFFTISIIIFLLVSDYSVTTSTEKALKSEPQNIEENRVGLLLGTRKVLSNGQENLYYKYRIEAAIELYNSKKIEFILVSGDNSRKEYDEPTDMQMDLIAAGIPKDKIYKDYAGFRTLDSVVRAKEIFGQRKLTIISQPFHNERAIYIAKNKGIEAVGFNARDVSSRYGAKTMIREKFARAKMVLDLLFNKSPKFLGKKVIIE